MFTVKFYYYLCQLRHKVFFDEKLVEVTFFCVDQQAPHRFEQVVENLREVDACILFVFPPFQNLVEDLEKKLNVARTYLQRCLW